MTKKRRVVLGGTLWSPEGAQEADVVIGEDGRVAAVVRRSPGRQSMYVYDPDTYDIIDATGKWVLPGGIDAHVHFREPGLTVKEDFATGSRSAAAGGVTTVLEMPNTVPPVSDGERLRAKYEAIAGRSYVDYGLFGAAIAPDHLDELEKSVEALLAGGVAGIKVLLGPTTGDLSAPTWGQLYQLMSRFRDETVFVFHCEDRSVIEEATPRVPSRFASEYKGLLMARPRFGELMATDGVLRLARETGARVHIAHVALAEAVQAIEAAKNDGAPVTAETCPQYLLLSEEEAPALGRRMNVLPPIRSKRDQEALWQGLKSGVIDFVATDHAPHETKRTAAQTAWEGPFGMAGVQTLVPLLLDQAIQGVCGVADVVRWTSYAPARAFGLYPRKGVLRPGADADLIVVDPDETWCVGPDWWQSKSANTAFWGTSGAGAPILTMLRGEVIVQKGQIVDPPKGRPLDGQ